MDLKYREENGCVIVEDVKDFNVVHIFECGQCFRWKKLEDGSYDMAAMGRRINVSVNGMQLTIKPCDAGDFEKIWKDYFDLETDYSEIKERLCAHDSIMRNAADFGWGIRILKQDLWEAIVEFIISQNNNIPRIKGCIERLCNLYGEPIGEHRPEDIEAELMCDIPSPKVLAGLKEEDLAPVRLGYRAGYLIKTAEEVLEKGMPENREELLALNGVGPKVASCIELFGMAHKDSFPIDVWVARLMHELYGLDEKNKKAMEVYAREKFCGCGGIAQQYLFYYERENYTSKND